jgi:hypothetical protein
MEMQQMMERLLAKIDATQERMDANTEAMQEAVDRQIWSLVSMIGANRKAIREETRAIFGADGKETMSCQVTTEACLGSKELDPEDMEYEVGHREAPTEEAAVKSSGTMKKRHRGRHLGAGRRGVPKGLT